jgi:WD40 repeat protein
MLASGSKDQTVRLWEAATGKQVRTFTGHEDWVRSLAWSPDGKRLASGSDDTTLLIWAVGNQADELPIRLELSELKSCWTDLAMY